MNIINIKGFNLKAKGQLNASLTLWLNGPPIIKAPAFPQI